MDIFQKVAKEVTRVIREVEDLEINYLLTGEIPEEFKCPNCRERLNPETPKGDAIV